MSTAPSEILGTANKLLAMSEITEADARAAISRAYYAALHTVSQCFNSASLAHVANSHEQIIGLADCHGKSIKPGRTEARLVARDMFIFKRLRKFADYEVDETLGKTDAQRAIALCQSILENCQNIQTKLSSAT
ncbi:MAG: hypothetical protein C0406_10365 [Sideroxydans sp.]|nr:hypothetical protein [Sideroxydans sp.]